MHALTTSGAPRDRTAVATALSTTALDTVVGHLDWTKGPVKNVAVEPLVGGRWVQGTNGFPVDVEIVEDTGFPAATIQAKDVALP